MTSVKIYGIKNCDTMKKALKWLDNQKVDYDFHDYKKEGADAAILKAAIKEHGWESVINKRGTTWRKLPDYMKESMNETTAQNVALENPSLIKRPLLVKNGHTHLGFSEDTYKKVLG